MIDHEWIGLLGPDLLRRGACLGGGARPRWQGHGLAMYEPPYNDDDAARRVWRDYRKQLTEALAEGRRGDAVGPP